MGYSVSLRSESTAATNLPSGETTPALTLSGGHPQALHAPQRGASGGAWTAFPGAYPAVPGGPVGQPCRRNRIQQSRHRRRPSLRPHHSGAVGGGAIVQGTAPGGGGATSRTGGPKADSRNPPPNDQPQGPRPDRADRGQSPRPRRWQPGRRPSGTAHGSLQPGYGAWLAGAKTLPSGESVLALPGSAHDGQGQAGGGRLVPGLHDRSPPVAAPVPAESAHGQATGHRRLHRRDDRPLRHEGAPAALPGRRDPLTPVSGEAATRFPSSAVQKPLESMGFDGYIRNSPTCLQPCALRQAGVPARTRLF